MLEFDRRKVASVLENIFNQLDDDDGYDSYYVGKALELITRKMHLKETFKVESGASKVVLVIPSESIVIKWSQYGYKDAEREVKIYRKAVSAGLQKFFPETEYFMDFHRPGFVFIAQEKIDFSHSECTQQVKIHYERIGRTVTPQILAKVQGDIKKAANCYIRDINCIWWKMAISLYGKRAVKELCTFIKENHINDLHESNIGYKNNRPILLDFSGYGVSHNNEY